MMKYKKFVFVGLLLLFIILLSVPAPSIHTYNQASHEAHARITRQAINILRNDWHRTIADATEQNIDAIIAGIRDADDELGRITLNILGVFDANWNTAGNMHYYDPNARVHTRGLKIGILHGTDTSIYLGYGWFIRLTSDRVSGIGDSNRVFALRGPQPSPDKLADWYYALAVKAMREGRTYEAYFNLGKAIHMVQDLTVPQHATNSYGLPHHRHQDFESYAENYLNRPEYLADRDMIFFLEPLSEYVHYAASQSAPKIGRVTWWSGNDFDGVSREMLHLAQRLTAGVLYKFHSEWSTKPYSVVKLTIHRAKALDGPDGYAAELYTQVKILGPDRRESAIQTTGYFGSKLKILG